MTEAAADPVDGLSDVLRLTATLSDEVLDAQIMGRPVPQEQVRALVKAARLLRERGVEWPPLLTQVLHELAEEVGEIEGTEGGPAGSGTESNLVIQGLTRLLGAFRREKAPS